ncbi:cleft lip and palate transmembrane 1 [Piedraia hortae CBS 480.64]|uniref:Cleft lip and palate transmembrane 1 n=1 Tax=Piedraia hortae CBS 480.64 TaxID=1314780 RepID=A0A6A7C1P9_9PEZI|nr:cleft lip and palate transmembrane 1 [Piedraia hortae CBS 480.64]
MPDQRAREANRPRQGWEDVAWSVAKNLLIFGAIQYAMRQFMGTGNQAKAPTPNTTPEAVPLQSQWSATPQTIYPLWQSNASVDLSMYVSPGLVMPRLHTMPPESLIVDVKNFSLDTSKRDRRKVHKTFKVPHEVQRNGTLWAHIFVAQTGSEMDPASPEYDRQKAYWMVRPLTQYLAKKKVEKTRNLLEAKNESDTLVPKGPTIASYYHPNISLSLIPEAGAVQLSQMHPAVRQYYTLESSGGPDGTGRQAWFYPPLYVNTFWQLKSQMTELNDTEPVETLPMNVDINTMPHWQFSIMASLDEGMKETARRAAYGQSTAGGGDGTELETIKEVLLNTNPWLLGTTGVVSILHMLFELLAFKSDVGHWRNKKDNVGVSVRTIISNVVMQTIIFLYLVDNNENTSWMILFGQGVGILIEAWKVTKTVDVRIRQSTPGSWFAKLGSPYAIVFEDKHKLSETEEKTEEYDRIAFKYMGIIAVPLLLAYATYSLVYETHKSWYSFIITTLVGSVYAYGFLMMVPSLYINYRLKSVAHMPARAMMYKFLNTFIDDLFAFTIKMPLLHRLATFRDDVIFFVYLYQAWAYKVDYSRVNEFGQGGEDDPKPDKPEPTSSSSSTAIETKPKASPRLQSQKKKT